MMFVTSDKLISVFSFYRDELVKRGIQKKQLEDFQYDLKCSEIPREDLLSHVYYMCDTAIGFVHEGRIEKAMRWLGYIQRDLFQADFYTLNGVKDHSRPDVQL